MNKHQYYSGEIYYGGASVGIPFLWESAPGTPKVKHHHQHPLPPLTPPPSFLSNKTRTSTSSMKPSRPGTGLFHAVLPKLIVMRRTGRHPSSPTNSSSSSSSTDSSPFTHHAPPCRYYSSSSGEQILRSGSRMRTLFLSGKDNRIRSSFNCFGIAALRISE